MLNSSSPEPNEIGLDQEAAASIDVNLVLGDLAAKQEDVVLD